MRKITIPLLLFISFTFYGQWKYPSLKKLKNHAVVTYKVTYDEEPTDQQKKSSFFKKEVIVYFNKHKLVERIITGKNDYQIFNLFDFDEEKVYYGSISSRGKKATVYNFKLGTKHTPKFKQEKDTILGIPSEICYYNVGPKTRKMYFTKELGLRYCKYYNLDGFLLQYSTKERYLGTYTVSATKIEYGKLDDSLYSLEGFEIRTKEERAKEAEELSKLRKKNNSIAIEKIDQEAPFISARSINGKKLRTKKLLNNKIVVLNFWFTSCPPCKKEIPQLNKLKKTFEGKDVEFIAITLDQEYKIANFLTKSPFFYNIIEDGRWIANEFDIKLYPTNMIIDKNGKIAYYKSGYRTDIFEAMEYKINKLLKQ